MRQRRHQGTQARSGGALAAAALCLGGARWRAASATAALEGTVRAQGVSHRSVQPMDPPEARGGIAGGSRWRLLKRLSEKLRRGVRPACNTSHARRRDATH